MPFVKLIQEFHDGMAGSVSVGGTITDPFEISHGLKQGCVLAPTLFTLSLSLSLSLSWSSTICSIGTLEYGRFHPH